MIHRHAQKAGRDVKSGGLDAYIDSRADLEALATLNSLLIGLEVAASTGSQPPIIGYLTLSQVSDAFNRFLSDFNADAFVNTVSGMIRNSGTTDKSATDLNGDGVINTTDLFIRDYYR